MKVLFIGDSIVEGSIGADFTGIIARERPHVMIDNHGIPGDTLPGICRRLLQQLAREPGYDCILLEGGHNDICMTGWFPGEGDAAARLAGILDRALQQVRHTYRGRLVLATLSCLGEDLEGAENRIRARLNRQIFDLAPRYGCRVADVGGAFDEVLAEREEDGRLRLTIDGVHLNARGAEIYAQVIGRCLDED
jgi:lysophospholipase L1-like esterase